MTNRGLENAAALIMLGLVLNGCLSMDSGIDERALGRSIGDELGKSIKEAGCLSSGRSWEYGNCIADMDEVK